MRSDLQRPSKLMLITVFLCLALSFLIYQCTHKLRVFVLHSYHPSMSWVQGLETGVEQVFKKKRYIDIRSYYMNTKRKTSPAYLRRASRQAMTLIKNYKPDVLIVFDVDAQKWVAKKLINDADYAIVLAGITDSDDLIKFQSSSNVTGVLERMPVKVVQEVLSLMLPKARRLYYLSDDSSAAKQLDKDVADENWGHFKLVAHHKAKTFSQWKHFILKAQTKADVILLSTYQIIRHNGKRVPSIDLIQWTLAHSKIPVIGLYESFVNDGGYLAIAVASVEQGYTAAKIAMFLLDKKIKINSIPFIQSQTFQLQMRKRLVKKHYPYIIIPSILESFSNTKWQLDDLTLKQIE